MSKLIVGTGPPRCGTTSLQVLLHHCTGADIYHEAHGHRLPFEASDSVFRKELQRTLRERSGAYIGSVSFAWMPYIDHLQAQTEANVIGLLRDPDDYVESCLATQPDERIQSPKYPMFPTVTTSAEEGWRKYHSWAKQQFNKFDVPTFRTSNLADKDVQSAIFHEAGISVEDRQYQPNVHYNRRED